jgi:hypothetical protein
MRKLLLITTLAVISFAAVPDTELNHGFKLINLTQNDMILKVIMNRELPNKNSPYVFTQSDVSNSLASYKQARQAKEYYGLNSVVPK